jgi:hypothetical protein
MPCSDPPVKEPEMDKALLNPMSEKDANRSLFGKSCLENDVHCRWTPIASNPVPSAINFLLFGFSHHHFPGKSKRATTSDDAEKAGGEATTGGAKEKKADDSVFASGNPLANVRRPSSSGVGGGEAETGAARGGFKRPKSLTAKKVLEENAGGSNSPGFSVQVDGGETASAIAVNPAAEIMKNAAVVQKVAATVVSPVLPAPLPPPPPPPPGPPPPLEEPIAEVPAADVPAPAISVVATAPEPVFFMAEIAASADIAPIAAAIAGDSDPAPAVVTPVIAAAAAAPSPVIPS